LFEFADRLLDTGAALVENFRKEGGNGFGIRSIRRSWRARTVTNLKLPHRRQFLHLAAGAAALPAMSRVARAQAYPTRPVRVVVSVIAGGVDDILVRLINQRLPERLGQPFVIDNQDIGTYIKAIVNASPDGYTLGLIIAANVIRVTLDQKLNFDFTRDIAPVAGISRNPFVMVVNPSVPAKTVPDFIAYAKANPGKLNMASSGNGNLVHLSGALFEMMTDIDMRHAPYQGVVPAVTGLLSGQAQVMFATMPPSIQHIKAGELRALAVTSATRSETLPDIPTVGDFVPGYEASGFQGLVAPGNTPAEIIDKISKEVNASVADPKFKKGLTEFGNTILPLSSAEFGKLIANETEKWAKVIKFAGIKLG
jgi:tripartite-type tricarboxylate transporter receptor subunit TctC